MASKKGPPPPPRDLTTEILVQIRDELRETRDTFKKELGDLRHELGDLRHDLERLERRQREDATRLATELVAVAQAVGQVRDLLREQRVDRERLDDHEQRLRTLEKRSA
ncbi:MAG: hypothetical protein KIT84_34480 [Labilithrix sp.]|nr:hypothetical protein [Labilithrix sp.]MCW5816155.1 hypothetical protein [Labilithrix sp.]